MTDFFMSSSPFRYYRTVKAIAETSTIRYHRQFRIVCLYLLQTLFEKQTDIQIRLDIRLDIQIFILRFYIFHYLPRRTFSALDARPFVINRT